MQVVDEVRCVVRAIAAMEKSAKANANANAIDHSASFSIRRRAIGILSPFLKWVSFVVSSALLAAAVVAETIFVATLHVLTNALLLYYRAYRSEARTAHYHPPIVPATSITTRSS